MADKILTSIKDDLGIQAEDTSFDSTVKMHINDALMRVKLLGAGKAGVTLKITGDSELWTDLFVDDEVLSAVQGFVFLRVQQAFDPADNSFKVLSFDRQIKEKASNIRTLIEEGDVI